MRRRRKFNGTWFPAFGTEVEGEDDAKYWGLEDTVDFESTAGSIVTLFTINPDQPTEDFDDPQRSLADSIGSEYALQRFVGTFECFPSSTTGTTIFSTWTVCLAFFVARCDHATPDIPVGCTNNFLQSRNDPSGNDSWNDYSPLSLATIRQPWIWRREWRIQNQGTEGGPPWNIFPLSIATQGGGNLNAGHVDAKTRRRVKKEERLFGALAIQPFPFGVDDTPGPNTTTFSWRLEGRTYGALRRSRGKSAF